MSRTEQLISGFLDDRLDPADAKELADLLGQDRALCADFIELYRQHRLLSKQYATTSKSNFVQSVLADLRVENRNFVSGIINELRQQRQQADLKERASQVKRSSRIRTSESQNFWSRFCWPSLIEGGAMAAPVAWLIIVFYFFVSRKESLAGCDDRSGRWSNGYQ
jgi:hypothetical protein